MKDIVCTQKQRPPASDRWLNQPVRLEFFEGKTKKNSIEFLLDSSFDGENV